VALLPARPCAEQAFSFPRRTVLLLGREKEGIPADLLALMHHTVEIPQLGVVRRGCAAGCCARGGKGRQRQQRRLALQRPTPPSCRSLNVHVGALAIHQYTQQALAAAAGASPAAGES
jgi:tRNA(Leu) C34 or U34 (ribose-2'-O)-methylase TrmL